MKLDVHFTPAGLTPAELQGRTVFVIDILRATTAMCAALLRTWWPSRTFTTSASR